MSMNNQEAAEKMAYHLGFQNKQSKDGNGNCLYRGPNELKCALGCLIPDELYESKFDIFCYSVKNLKEHYALFDKIDAYVLIIFQKIHDEYNSNEWKMVLIYHLNNSLKYLNKEKVLEAYDKGCLDRLNNE